MKYKAVIFDLDGVIVSTDKLHYEAWKHIADELKIPFDEMLNNRLRGVSRMESLDIILTNAKLVLSAPEKEKAAFEKNECYKKLLKTLTPLSVDDDIIQTLVALRAKGLKLAIGSSSKNARMILENIKLVDYFDAISDGNNITLSKPNPEVFLKAAGFLSLTPFDCVVVEDAKAGIDAALAGGFLSVGIGDAYDYDKSDIKIRRLSELLKVL